MAGEQSMMVTSKSPAASSSANFKVCSWSKSSFWSMRSMMEGMTCMPLSSSVNTESATVAFP